MNDPDTIPPLKVTYQGRRYLLKGKPGDGPGVFTYELSGFSPLGNDDDDKSEHDEGLAPGDCNPPNFIRPYKIAHR